MGKSLIPEGKWSRLTLLWSFAQFIIMSIIECIIIYINWKNKENYENKNIKEENYQKILNNYHALIVYQVLFIVAMVYQLYLAVDTLLKFSTIDLIALSVFNTLCLGYSVTQYIQSYKIVTSLDDVLKQNNITLNDSKFKSSNFELINIGLMLVFAIGWWYITFRLYKVFGWNVFKQIGADIRLKQRLKLFNILITLLKLTSFFIALFMIQYIALVILGSNFKTKNDIDYIRDVTYPVIIVIGSGFGIIAVTKINRIYLGIYIFTLCALLGFMAHTLLDIKEDHQHKYSNSKISLRVTIGSTLVISLVTYVVSLINFKNFGLGIPKSINKNTLQAGQSNSNQQKRLSID